MKRIYGFAFILVAMTASVFQCSRTALLAGNSSSETTNGCMAAVYRSDGSLAVGAQVRLRRSDYVSQPITSLTKSAIYTADVLTDAQGRFQIFGIDEGDYSIEVNDPSEVPGQGDAVLLSCTVGMHDTVNLGTDTLRPYASVQGALDTFGMSGKSLFVQILGLERLISIGPSGGFVLDDLPAGLFSLRIISVAGPLSSVVRTGQVAAVSGDTVGITMPGWGFAKKLFLNTTAAGANVSGNVYGFPLLVRLASPDFDFLQARDSGQDIRFTKSNGAVLPYEIERWDAAHGSAEIWVKVDTIFGNNGTQQIMMYWGNPSTASASNGPAVFDTANGFGGVWHLNEQTGNVSDATLNANTGKDEGTSSLSGIAGNARYFQNSRISMGASSVLCSYSDSITISGWFKSTQKPSSTVSVIRHVGHITAMQFDQARQFTSFWTVQSADYTDITIPVSTVNFIDGSWHYITARFKAGTGCFVYTDGDLIGQNTIDTAALHTTTGAFYLGGTESGNEYFDGSLDEIRIERAFRSPDWEKLCYMNQRTDDKLIKSR